jgi:hypothetical protein
MRKRDLERKLRDARAEPRAGLVDELARRAGGSTRRGGLGSRLAFGASLTVMILGTFASFGGLSYAASGGTSALRTIQKVTTAHTVVVAHSSADSQYPKAGVKPAVKKVTHKKAPAHQVLGTTVQSGTLPFTGISLLVTVLLSLALMGGGLLLRKAERNRS